MKSPARKDDMMLDRVDDEDRVVGQIRRGDVFDEQAGFRVVHVFVLDRGDRLLLQRLAPQKQRHPGRWGSSVAGYVAAGESYDEAARRRTREELGLDDVELQALTTARMDDRGCTKFIRLYQTRSDGPFAPDRGEIAELRFEDLDVIRKEVQADPDRFTPTFIHFLENHLTPHPAG